MPDSEALNPEWDRVLPATARLQQSFPDAVLVGGTVAALHLNHRFSHDADHILTDLVQRFEAVLNQPEAVAGRNTSRVQRPVLILGSLDCIETGVRQLRRTEPLETVTTVHKGARIAIPTHAEILRIKAWLILQRNATRDYIDFVALAAQMRLDAMTRALANFDSLYPQDSGESVIQQLQA